MSVQLAKWTKIWLHGYHLSTDFNNSVIGSTSDELESGGFTLDKRYKKGRVDSIMTLDGFFATQTHAALQVVDNSPSKICTKALGNNALPIIGDPTASLDAQQMNYDVSPPLNELIAVTAQLKAKNSNIEWGNLLADVIITDDISLASYDSGASSSNGGVGIFHIAALSAGDTITGKIQHSSDDSVWADLIVFTLDGTAILAERLTVAGAVDRYLRADLVVTSGPTIFPIMMTFIRN